MDKHAKGVKRVIWWTECIGWPLVGAVSLQVSVWLFLEDEGTTVGFLSVVFFLLVTALAFLATLAVWHGPPPDEGTPVGEQRDERSDGRSR